MKKIEWFWNIIHFNVYRFDLKCRELFNNFNPIYLINKIPAIKRHHAKHGVNDMNKFANSILNNPKIGISSIWSGSFMGGLIVLVEYGIFNIIQGLASLPLIQAIWNDSLYFIIYLILLLIPTVLINNSFLFRKDKYLNYFKEFELMSKNEKTKYGWVSFFVILLVFSFFIGSFLILRIAFK